MRGSKPRVRRISRLTAFTKANRHGLVDILQAQSVVFSGRNSVDFIRSNVDVRKLSPYEVVVEARCSVVSPGTELARYRGENFGSGQHGGFPSKPGYAMAGLVLAAGKETGLEEGARVLSYTPHQSIYRFDKRKVLCVPLPDNLAFDVSPFGRLAQVGGVALQVSSARPDDVVAVVGLGPIGNLAAQLAVAGGYRVLGIEKSEYRRELAQACGLQRVVDPSEAQSELSGLGGARLVLECSGSAAALLLSVELCAPYGEILTIGAPWKVEADVPASALVALIFEKYLSLRSGWEWQLPIYDQRTGRSVEACLKWVLRKLADGFVVTSPLVSGTLRPIDAASAYELLDTNPEENFTFLLNWNADDNG